MKKEIRVIGIDDAPFDKFHNKKVLVVGIIYRGGQFMDGAVSTSVSVDGNDATKKIAEMINRCKFNPQLRCIFLKGIAVAGFNIIDIRKLHELTRLPVIVVMRHYPKLGEIRKALKRIKKERRFSLIEGAGKIQKAGKICMQFCGTTKKNAEEFLKVSTTRAQIPEPLRIAHLIAGGIVAGESRGHA